MAETLILVRHGRIEANSRGLWHGSTDSPLVPKGLQQARRTGKHLAFRTPAISAIYTSPLDRCQHTAGLIADALNAPLHRGARKARRRNAWHRVSRGLLGSNEPPPAQAPLQPTVVPDLREYAIGDWEGLPFAELASSHRFIERAAADLHFAPPNGESLHTVSHRVSRALTELHARHEDHEHILIVSHGAVLGIALATLLNNDPSMWMDYHFDNCSVSELALGDYPKRLPELRHFNLTGHL